MFASRNREDHAIDTALLSAHQFIRLAALSNDTAGTHLLVSDIDNEPPDILANSLLAILI